MGRQSHDFCERLVVVEDEGVGGYIESAVVVNIERIDPVVAEDGHPFDGVFLFVVSTKRHTAEKDVSLVVFCYRPEEPLRLRIATEVVCFAAIAADAVLRSHPEPLLLVNEQRVHHVVSQRVGLVVVIVGVDVVAVVARQSVAGAYPEVAFCILSQRLHLLMRQSVLAVDVQKLVVSSEQLLHRSHYNQDRETHVSLHVANLLSLKFHLSLLTSHSSTLKTREPYSLPTAHRLRCVANRRAISPRRAAASDRFQACCAGTSGRASSQFRSCR